MTKLEDWEKNLKILKQPELDLLRLLQKYRGQTQSHIRDSKQFYKYLVMSQRILEKVLKKFKHNYSRTEAWLKEHDVKMSDDTIRKYVNMGKMFKKLENRIDKVQAHKGITRDENLALKRILHTLIIERNKSFEKLLKEVMDFRKNWNKKSKKKQKKKGKGEWKTEEEERLEQLTQETLVPKGALESKTKTKQAKGKPLGKEGERIKKLLKEYEGK